MTLAKARKFSSKKPHSQGFTLVEVVIVIILIGILAVSVAPKFQGSSGYDIYTYRDQIKSSLQLAQLKAMQQTQGAACHQILLNAKLFGRPDTNTCAFPTLPSFSNDWRGWEAAGDTNTAVENIHVASNHNVAFSIDGVGSTATINFDSLGRPQESCAGGCVIRITGDSLSIAVRIESEGYIHVD